MPFLYILNVEGAGWTFTAQKSAGNHTKRGPVNAQQAFIPIQPPPPPPPPPFRTALRHEFKCS